MTGQSNFGGGCWITWQRRLLSLPKVGGKRGEAAGEMDRTGI